MNVPTSIQPSFTFIAALDPARISTTPSKDTVALCTNAGCGQLVAGSLSIAGDYTSVTFIPDSPLEANTTYNFKAGRLLKLASGGGIQN